MSPRLPTPKRQAGPRGGRLLACALAGVLVAAPAGAQEALPAAPPSPPNPWIAAGLNYALLPLPLAGVGAGYAYAGEPWLGLERGLQQVGAAGLGGLAGSAAGFWLAPLLLPPASPADFEYTPQGAGGYAGLVLGAGVAYFAFAAFAGVDVWRRADEKGRLGPTP